MVFSLGFSSDAYFDEETVARSSSKHAGKLHSFNVICINPNVNECYWDLGMSLRCSLGFIEFALSQWRCIWGDCWR